MQNIILYIVNVSHEGSNIYDKNVGKNGIKTIQFECNIEILNNMYPNVYLCLGGDFNARTKDLLDYIPHDNRCNILLRHR
jgi:hypothetical protein